ncbi:hypothetical protein BH23THE1_BH23THE1_29750 [soil metagenome]
MHSMNPEISGLVSNPILTMRSSSFPSIVERVLDAVFVTYIRFVRGSMATKIAIKGNFIFVGIAARYSSLSLSLSLSLSVIEEGFTAISVIFSNDVSFIMLTVLDPMLLTYSLFETGFNFTPTGKSPV